MRTLSRRVIFLVMMAIFGASFSGCAYLKNRGGDAADILDVGVTLTKSPQVAIYAGFNSLLSVGYAGIDQGKMFGMGDRQFGLLDMRYKAAGMVLEGYEQYGFDKYPSYFAVSQNYPPRRGAGLGLIHYERPQGPMEAL